MVNNTEIGILNLCWTIGTCIKISRIKKGFSRIEVSYAPDKCMSWSYDKYSNKEITTIMINVRGTILLQSIHKSLLYLHLARALWNKFVYDFTKDRLGNVDLNVWIFEGKFTASEKNDYSGRWMVCSSLCCS